jgi:Ca2+-binding RTX toxin-like protein
LLRWEDEQLGAQYTLSLRSTEFKPFNKGGDRARDAWGADAEVASKGLAFGQLASLEDFYRREVLPIVGSQKIHVTGYSLGGHLATVFTEIHADAVKAAYVFNSPGRGSIPGPSGTAAEQIRAMIARFHATLLSEPNEDPLIELTSEQRKVLLPQYRNALRAHLADPDWNPFAPSDARAYDDPRYRWAMTVTRTLSFPPLAPTIGSGLSEPGNTLITSIYGNALKNDTTLVANSLVHASTKRPVYIEGQPFVEGIPTQERSDFGNTHAITLLVDSLALMREFERLDPTLTQAPADPTRPQARIESLIQASSSRKSKPFAALTDGNAAEGDSLEKALFALRRAFDPQAAEVRVTFKPGDFGDIVSREEYYRELARLPQEGSYTILPLTDKSASQIVELAKRTDATGLAVRHALLNLYPFAVVGGNYGPTRYANGELDIDTASSGRGVTERWMEARARFLEKLLRYNVADGDLSESEIGAHFSDQARNISLGLVTPLRPNIIFASDSNQLQLSGSPRDDFIFGGANGESIVTGTGKDYVEAGGGDDRIDGGWGADTIHGGGGDDRLTGGLNADKLFGGAGFDTYVYGFGDGQDEIFDSDGRGEIVYRGRTLAGGTRAGTFEYVDDAGVRYELVGGGDSRKTLVIDGKITVRNFLSGELGISLTGDDPRPTPPEIDAARTYTQDPLGFWVPYPTDRPPKGPSVEETLRREFVNIYGSDANDVFAYVDFPLGLPGFYGRGGDDEVTIGGAAANATVNGGAGQDIIDASAATLAAGPGAQPVTLVGGAGDDYILAGATDDVIWGDNYRVQNSFRSRPGAHLIDDFIVNLKAAFPDRLQDASPATLSALENAGAHYFENGPLQLLGAGARVPEYILADINLGADALVRYLQLEGWLGLGELSAAVDFVLGTDPTFDDYIDAGAGNDNVKAGNGSDRVLGGPGNDLLDGDAGVSVEVLGELASRFGEAGDDHLDGGEGDDILSDLLGGNDTLIGGAGNDVITSDERVWLLDPGKSAFNRFDGGDGNDSITSTNRTPDGYEIVDGGAGNDFIRIDSLGGGFILGGDGNDTILASSSRAGGEVFEAEGGAGDDTYFVSNGVIRDESGNDTVVTIQGTPASADAMFDAAARGQLGLPPGLTLHQEVSRDGNDLVLVAATTMSGQSSSFSTTLADWFAGEAPPIERFLSEGGVLAGDEIAAWGSLTIAGGEDDVIAGGEHRDRIVAGAGADLVSAGGGSDLIAGGTGDDVLDGGDGSDSYYYAPGDGNDLIMDEGGDDRLVFGQGIGAQDVTVGSIGASSITLSVAGATIELEGPAGALAIETLVFADGGQVAVSSLLQTALAVTGAAGNDFLGGNDAANTIAGGPGDDLLAGGAGSDTYQFNLGDGIDRIADAASAGESNVLRFGPGISRSSLSLGLGSLEIRVGEGGDAVHLENVDPGDLLGAHDVDLFEFDDGTTLTYAELLSQGLDLEGTSSEDFIPGSSIADRIRGYGGDDLLVESAGDDAYFFGRGDGSDTLVEDIAAFGGSDRLVFAADIPAADVSVLASGSDVVLRVADGGGSVTVQGAMLYDVIESVEFGDGSAWDGAMLRAAAGPLPAEGPAGGGGEAGAAAGAQAAAITGIDIPAPFSSAIPAAREETLIQAEPSLVSTESRTSQIGVPSDPLAREMQERFDVLLQVGRANLGERYAEAVREFEERRRQLEESPPPPPPADEEIEAWNTAMHAWHERHPGFGEADLGGAGGGWAMGWGLPASAQLEGGSPGLPSLANPHTLPRLTEAGAAPGLSEGFRPLQ